MMFSIISFSVWNINALSNRALGDKLSNIDFLDSVNDCDFVALSEILNRSNVKLPGYNTFTSLANKSNPTGRQSGGIAFFFKSKYQKHLSIIQNSYNFLWCKLSKEAAG